MDPLDGIAEEDEEHETIDYEDEEEEEDSDGSPDVSVDHSDYSYHNSDSDSSDVEVPECTCRRCITLKELREYPYVHPDDRNTKFDVYHLAHFMFNLTDVIDLPVSVEFLPKLIKKIKDKMKFGLQEDLMKLLYFPGHGYLPHTAVLLIVEMLLKSAVTAGDREIVKFEVNQPHISEALSGAYGAFEEIHHAISSQWPPYFPTLKLPGECAAIIDLYHQGGWLVGNILFLLDDVKILIPEFSFEEGQYEKFLVDIHVGKLRKHVKGVMKCNMNRTLGPKERENLTEYVYALRMTYDHTADILTPHVENQDIVTMCKIYKSSD